MTFDQLCEAKPSDALSFALGAFLEKSSLELNEDRKPLGRHFSASGNTANRFGLIAIAKSCNYSLSATMVLENVVAARKLDREKAIRLDTGLNHLRNGDMMSYFYFMGMSRKVGLSLTTRIAHFAFNPALFKSNIESLIFKLKANGF
jgi:hypothetical protein